MLEENEERLTENGLSCVRMKTPRSLTRTALPQIVLAVGLGLTSYVIAAMNAMPTFVLGALQSPNSTDVHITASEASWIGSAAFLVHPMGSVTSGFVQDVVGRRWALIFALVPLIASWLLLYLSSSLMEILTAASVMGFCVGFMEAPSLSYIGESCQPTLRGTLGALTQIFYLFGQFGTFLLDSFLPWRSTCFYTAVVPAMALGLIIMAPETPVWLIVSGRRDKAEDSLRWLRGWVSKDLVQHELESLADSYQQSFSDNSKSKLMISLSQVQFLAQPQMYRPMAFIGTFFFVGTTVSLLGAKPYWVSLLQGMKVSVSHHWILVLAAMAEAIGCICLISLIHKCGKRLLALVSLFGCTLCCILFSVYTYFEVRHDWLPAVFIVSNSLFAGLGMTSIPWTLIMEIFPLKGKGIAVGISAAMCFLFVALLIKTFIYFESVLSLFGIFLVYGLIGVFGLFYIYKFMPETEGLTLPQIELLYKD